LKDLVRIGGKRLSSSFMWEEFTPTDVWVENNIYLNSDVSPITGYMQLKYTPHLREMMNDFDKSHIWKFTAMFSSQCGKTTAMFGLIAKALDTDPTNMQLSIPADNGVPDYIIGKFDPFFRGIKSLQRKFEQFKETEKKRSVTTRKRVAGGTLFITGTGEKERRSRTVKYLFLDEVSLFPVGSVTELIGRTKAYEKFFRKVFLVSTLKEENDEIAKAYKDSKCKKEWEIQCPHCKEFFYPTSKHFYYYSEDEHSKTLGGKEFDLMDYRKKALSIEPYLICPHCESHIYSTDKDKQILDGNCRFNVVEGSEKDTTVGYKANALAMYSTNFSTIAELLINADNFEQKAIVYIDYFNEIYEENNKSRDKNDILLLGNGLRKWEVPADTVKLYLTVDTQKDHFYYQITAYQYGFIGNTVAHGRIETTHDIKTLLYTNLKDSSGREYKIDRCLIDRRGLSERTTVVDEFVIEVLNETGEQDIIWAYEGVAEIAGNILFKMKRYKKSLDGEDYEFKIMSVSNIMAKNELNSMITRTIDKVNDNTKDYTRRLFYINQDIIDDESGVETTKHSYIRHMTSEELVYKVTKGKRATKKSWEKINTSVRNDYWDCSVMSVALAEADLVANIQKPKIVEDDGSKLLSLFS